MDEQSVKKLAKLLIDIESVSDDLKKRRKHPTDILPIENPYRLAKRLDDAMEEVRIQCENQAAIIGVLGLEKE